MPLYTHPVREAPVLETAQACARDQNFTAPQLMGAGLYTLPTHRRTIQNRRSAPTYQAISVLFVDERNRARSLIAHAQAEITRLWTLNQRGYNLFSAVDSAGLHLDSSLTRQGSWHNHRAGEPAREVTVQAVMGQPQFREGEDLKARFLNTHRTRAIQYEDFDQFDYILAFDSSTLTDLRILEWAAYRRARARGKDGLRARTKYLGEFNPLHNSAVRIPEPQVGRTPQPRDFRSTTRLVEQELHNFLHAVTGWVKPERIALDALATRYRSRQFLARRSRVTDAKLRTIKLLHGEKVVVDDSIPGRDDRIVTVFGREGNQLSEAVQDAQAAFL